MAQIDNRRLAKNTLILYGRTIFSLFISLLASRVTLHVLGISNYGINSAVAGAMAMLSVVAGSLSGSISRFISFELGRGDIGRLKKIFSTAINIQLLFGAVVILVGETLGVWFLNTQMNIPDGRMVAANWVFQCALVSFFIGLTQSPYTALIIGHERMSAYAWFSVLSSILRLAIVYMLYLSPYDKLVSLSVLGLMVSVGIRMAQRLYCRRKFEECRYELVFDRTLMVEMSGFAGWTFLTHTAWIFSKQGISVLINIFFGVTYNAACGLALSLEGAVRKFYNDFMTAIKPQITKSYAAGEIAEMNRLICQGTRIIYYLMFIIILPLMVETYSFLYLWLGEVPEYTVLFFRLSMVGMMVTLLGQTGVISVMASGQVKLYTIVISSIAFLVLPITYVAYRTGAAVEIAYLIFILIFAIEDVVRLFIMRHIWGFPVMMYLKDALLPIIIVTIVSLALPVALYPISRGGLASSMFYAFLCFLSASLTVSFVGLKTSERAIVMNNVKKMIGLPK